jgi:copper ion binding protein
MDSAIKSEVLRVKGMTCINCQTKLQKHLEETTGVFKTEVCYSKGTAAIDYAPDIVKLEELHTIIDDLGYTVLTGDEQPQSSIKRVIGFLVIIAASFFVLEHFGLLSFLTMGGMATADMGYGMMLLIGLTTSVHCVGMCGGIVLSQCIPRGCAVQQSRLSAIRPALLYNFGRVAAYTMVGFIVGGVGSAITFTTSMQGVLRLIAGVFMLVMGINMLGLFPWLRKLNPRIPAFIGKKVAGRKGKSKSPLIIGLLTGIMPCGPLQAAQIYALSTGSPITGAISMFLFSIGTVPLLFGVGAFAGIIGSKKNLTNKVMAVGAVLVAVLGLSMFSQGWNLAGFTQQNAPVESSETVIVLTVEGMTCSSCVYSVTREVSALVGVTDVTITLSTGMTVIEHDSHADEAAIKEAITALGFRII